MTDYTPTKGDRVKVTLEGEITFANRGGDFIILDVVHAIRVKGATFEKIPSPLPQAVGSVIKARLTEDGQAYVMVRTVNPDFAWYCPELTDSYRDKYIILDSIILDNGAE